MKMILKKVKILFIRIYSSYMNSLNLCSPSHFVSSEMDLFFFSAGSDNPGITEDLKGANYTELNSARI